jgi:hypothetical protein
VLTKLAFLLSSFAGNFETGLFENFGWFRFCPEVVPSGLETQQSVSHELDEIPASCVAGRFAEPALLDALFPT